MPPYGRRRKRRPRPAGSGLRQRSPRKTGVRPASGCRGLRPALADGTRDRPAYADLATQYRRRRSVGTGQRRRGSRWWIVVVNCAVLVAAAIGAGTALALRHNSGGSSETPTTAVVEGRAPTTAFGSVNALNNQSASVPAGWTTETGPCPRTHSAGFPPAAAGGARGRVPRAISVSSLRRCRSGLPMARSGSSPGP